MSAKSRGGLAPDLPTAHFRKLEVALAPMDDNQLEHEAGTRWSVELLEPSSGSVVPDKRGGATLTQARFLSL